MCQEKNRSCRLPAVCWEWRRVHPLLSRLVNTLMLTKLVNPLDASVTCMYACMHMHAYACTYTRARTHTHTYIHARMHTLTHVHVCILSHVLDLMHVAIQSIHSSCQWTVNWMNFSMSYCLIGPAVSQAFSRQSQQYEHLRSSLNDRSTVKTKALLTGMHALVINPYLFSPTLKSVSSWSFPC